MSFQIRYEGESHHLLPIVAAAMVDDPIAGGQWFVEVTTHGGERTVKGSLVAYTPDTSREGATITVRPLDEDAVDPSGEPDVTLYCIDVEELVIP